MAVKQRTVTDAGRSHHSQVSDNNDNMASVCPDYIHTT